MGSLHKNVIGPQVRRRRCLLGLSQERLTARLQLAGLDISRTGLAKIEARIREAPDVEVLVIAHALQCEPGDLFPKKTPGMSFRDFLAKLLQKVRTRLGPSTEQGEL